MTTVHSFPPIVDDDARVLILGSMPGVASLEANRYYAHPRNAFWPIMASVFEFDAKSRYEDRTAALLDHGIAVWDVLKLCTRRGSLDSAIVESSIVPNDIASLLRDHGKIDRIFFNGAKAESSFRRHVRLPDLAFTTVRLPSTSPAHASLTFDQKLDTWRTITEPSA
nr:DNA-deoxyinosine glycosylase [Rhodococcus sp. (in: high G+C Gram-positive bacteria)]